MEETSYETSQAFMGEPGPKCAHEKKGVDLKVIEEVEFTDDGGRRRSKILDKFPNSHFNGWVIWHHD